MRIKVISRQFLRNVLLIANLLLFLVRIGAQGRGMVVKTAEGKEFGTFRSFYALVIGAQMKHFYHVWVLFIFIIIFLFSVSLCPAAETSHFSLVLDELASFYYEEQLQVAFRPFTYEYSGLATPFCPGLPYGTEFVKEERR